MKKQKLSRREEEIMEYFWEKGPLYVKEIVNFYDEPRPHFNTISTFVRGLEANEYVSHQSFNGSYRYFAIVSRDEYKKKTLKGIVSKYFNNSYLGLVSSFVQEEEISVDELKDLIREIEKGNSGK